MTETRRPQFDRMSAAARIGGFAVVLAVIFAAATLAGAKLDPSVDEPDPGHDSASEAMDGHESSSGATAGDLPGLAVADAGYRLVPARTSVASGPSAEYAFRIVGPDGETVREFEVEHERRMHLIVVRRDFEGFQHLHPEQLPDGTWAVELDARLPGVHRVFADFAAAGRSLTLGTDLFVPGDFDPEPLPPVASTADAGDGYEVAVDTPSHGEDAGRVHFTITRNGRKLRSVEPYLGADVISSPFASTTRPSCTHTPRASRAAGDRSRSRSSIRAPGATGSSCSSSARARSAPPPSRGK